MEEIVKLLQMGGDVSTIALVILLWKFDRRILRLELKIFGSKQNVS